MNKCISDQTNHFEILKECSAVQKNLLKGLKYLNEIYKADETYVFEVIATIRNKPKKLIVKIAKYKYNDEYDLEYYKKLLREEAENCIYMSDTKIGPKVYEVFYTNDPKNSRHTKGIVKQYIIMDSMTSNASAAMKNKNISMNDKLIVVEKMFKLLKKQIDLGLYCYDIKPKNYTVNIEHNKVTDVKMIDFGRFCKDSLRGLKYNDLTENDLLIAMYIQLMLFIFVEHRRVYKEFKKTKFYNSIMHIICEDIDHSIGIIRKKGYFKEQLKHYFHSSHYHHEYSRYYYDFLEEMDEWSENNRQYSKRT